MNGLMATLLCAILGYLLGNFQTGLIIGRLTANIDLRKFGSGGTGATNALRILGNQSAAFTLAGDFLKGLLASLIGLAIGGWFGGLAGGAFAVIGHIFPVFYGFRGGKGVATSLGAMAPLTPLLMLLLLAVGITLLVAQKIVSLASLVASAVYLVAGCAVAISRGDWALFAFCLVLPLLVGYAHRENIGRLLNGTENKLSRDMFKSKKK